MFKITQNTIHHYSLAEILLMAAMNEVEVKRKPPTMSSGSERLVELGDDRSRGSNLRAGMTACGHPTQHKHLASQQ